tara:strand:+ start:168 stop:578 length:411 start_codon:yes stop_codon:yes gene_type:complete
MKRGEKTRLVREFLQKNPTAKKQDVMERFDISDAMFYNTRKKLQNGSVAKKDKNLERARKVMRAGPKKSPAKFEMAVSVETGLEIVLNCGQTVIGKLELAQNGLAFQSDCSQEFDTLLTWDNFSSLQKSGLLDKSC